MMSIGRKPRPRLRDAVASLNQPSTYEILEVVQVE